MQTLQNCIVVMMVDAGFIATEKQKALEGIVAFSREQSEVCSAHYPTFGVIAPVYLALRGSRLCERFGRFIHVFSQNVYVQLVVSLSKKKKKSSRFISFLSRLREWESLFAAGPRFTGTTRGGHGAWKHYNLPRYNHGMGRFCLELISSHSDLLFCALLACAIPFYVNENNLG